MTGREGGDHMNMRRLGRFYAKTVCPELRRTFLVAILYERRPRKKIVSGCIST